ncbi:MAG: mechanosensitive ion channel domain-containing protein [Azonexus sp.]
MRAALRAFGLFLTAVMMLGVAWATPAPETKAHGTEAATAEASLIVFNRTLTVFRAHFLGATPAVRAARARSVIEEALRQGGELVVTIRTNPEGQLIVLDDRLAFVITAGDADPLLQETPEAVAGQAARRLEQIVAETRESRNMESLLKALGATALATLVFGLLLWTLSRLRGWLANALLSRAERKVETLKIGNLQLIEGEYLIPFLRRLLIILRWLVVLLLSYEWLSFVLSRFPYTRPWGERLNDYLLNVAGSLLESILGAIPGLGVALVIFMLARVFIGFLGRFFERVSHTGAPVSWLEPETMPTTRRLFGIGIWLFAIAMAYPYLPGAQTEAFRGLSVLLGLMISLGASSVVGQGAAGLILTYTRTIRAGEYVRIGEHEGTVVKIGIFTTCIRTGLGEELTLPNSMITGAVTKNYSRTVDGAGYVVDTTVTIGYDTPWRQVEAMLIDAAKRTPGILDNPPPVVFQTNLSDFYPEYRLVAQAIPHSPRPRAEVLSQLHANIQDVFNEYGVQIMSPHYLADTAQAKVVKPDDWYPAPAKRPL